MIVLDTHVWAWWVEEPERLSNMQIAAISDQENDDNGIGICATSLWEIAKLVEYGRIHLSYDLPDWFELALAYPGVHILGLTPTIAIESTTLPGDFHRDPSDQIIVATARLNNCPLITSDDRIVAYTDVETI